MPHRVVDQDLEVVRQHGLPLGGVRHQPPRHRQVVERAGGFAYRFADQQLNVHGPGGEPSIVARDRVRPGNSDLCFVWAGTPESAAEHLRERGVEVELGPVERPGARGTGRSVYFRDPDGALLEFLSYE